MAPYHQAKLSITKEQQKKALKGAKIRIPQSCLGTGQIVMLHPLNYKKVVNAKGGINLELSPGEIMQTAAHHGMMPKPSPDMEGSGIFDSIWSGLKSAGKWLKDSGVGSALADVGQTLAAPLVGEETAKAGRQLLRATTGVGLKKRGKKTNGSGLYL